MCRIQGKGGIPCNFFFPLFIQLIEWHFWYSLSETSDTNISASTVVRDDYNLHNNPPMIVCFATTNIRERERETDRERERPIKRERDQSREYLSLDEFYYYEILSNQYTVMRQSTAAMNADIPPLIADIPPLILMTSPFGHWQTIYQYTCVQNFSE